jgi:hypothetical protein
MSSVKTALRAKFMSSRDGDRKFPAAVESAELGRHAGSTSQVVEGTAVTA